MRALVLVFVLSAALVSGGCASGRSTPEGGGPSILKVPEDQVPAAVKAIETQINRKAALVADEVEIHCSRNYEWDVSLVGSSVTPQKPDGGEQVSVATGRPRAMFRSLDIRAYNRIVFRKSGFDVVPFIRITAKGHAAHVSSDEGGEKSLVRRASLIQINNADIKFVDEQASAPPTRSDASPAAARGL